MGIARTLLQLGMTAGVVAAVAGCGCCHWGFGEPVGGAPPGYAYATDYLLDLPLWSAPAIGPNIRPPDPETVNPTTDHVIPNDAPPE